MPLDDANARPKVDKFAALAATQHKQQDATQYTQPDDLTVEEITEAVSGNRDDNEPDKKLPPLADALSHPGESLVAARPARRDKFASLAATATSASFNDVGNNPQPRRPVVDKFAAVQLQKQIDDLKQIRASTIELSEQRNGILADCETAEDMIVTLLRFVEQTATIYSDNTRWQIETPEIRSSREDFANLLDGYQGALVEMHGVLSKHAPHVKAYKSNEAEQVDTNSIYIQRVEHRLADTKVALMQDCLIAAKGKAVLSISESTASVDSVDIKVMPMMDDESVVNNKRKRDS